MHVVLELYLLQRKSCINLQNKSDYKNTDPE